MSSKIDYIDVYKGISILCITLLHFEDGVFPPWLSMVIGSFMVSSFYLTSGWLMGQKETLLPTKELAKKRLRSLGVPYLSFTIIFLCFDVILYFCGYYDSYFLAREVYKSLVLRGIGTLWFLPSLFFGEILLSYIINKRWRWQLCVLIGAFLYIWGYEYWGANIRNLSSITQIIDAPIKVINSALNAFIILFYSFYASILYKRHFKYRISLAVKMVLTICFLGIYFLLMKNSVPVPLFHYLTNSFLLFGMFLVSYFISRTPFINKFFIFWGKNSLIMMVTHYSIIQVLFEIFNKYLLGNSEFSGLITILFFLITVLIEYPIVRFFNHKGAFLLGKK